MRQSAISPLLVLGLLASSAGETSAEQQRTDAPAITVVGRGESFARPDTAQIQVGVATNSESAAAALEANNEAVRRLFDTLDELGVSEKDIQTSHLDISPRFRHDDRGRQLPEIAGYMVQNQLRIKVRKLSSLGRLLDELVGQGANQIHGISFSVNEPEAVLDEARRKAIDNARRKATLYAEACGVKLGQVQSIREQTLDFPRPMPEMAARMAAVESSVPIASGEQRFEATVTVRYAID